MRRERKRFVVAMANTFFRLLVIFLALSHLVSLNAAPVTRIGRLMHGPDQVLPAVENTHMVAEETSLEEERIRNGRMTVEVNDYPGSGANNRHTPSPRSQSGRCVDC